MSKCHGKAPHGWRCTREFGHEGPCAAIPIRDSQPINPKALALQAVQDRFACEIGSVYETMVLNIAAHEPLTDVESKANAGMAMALLALISATQIISKNLPATLDSDQSAQPY